MERSNEGAVNFFDNRDTVGARLDSTREWFDELGANLMEVSTERTAENIAELWEQRRVAQRDMGILAAYLASMESDESGIDTELGELITKELEGVR